MTTRTFHISHSVIRDDNITVIGSFNKIYGHNCRVEGGHNELFGNNCQVIGNFNQMHGSGCTATGDHNTDYFGNARMYGSFNSVRRGESSSSGSRSFSSGSSSGQSRRQNIVISNENETLIIDGNSYCSPRSSFTSSDGRTSVTYAGPGGLVLTGVSGVTITRGVVQAQPSQSSPKKKSAKKKSRPAPIPDEPPAEEGEAAENLCSICMERTVKTVILYCGHQVLCVTCSRDERLTLCPACRGKIKKIIRTYK